MQATIYIRKENQARWDEIKDKSAWVNAYLEKSPPNSKVLAEGLEPVSTPIIPKTTPVTKTGNLHQADRIMTAEDILTDASPASSNAARNVARSEAQRDHFLKEQAKKDPLCKVHGIRLDDRGRCLQKGCKYA